MELNYKIKIQENNIIIIHSISGKVTFDAERTAENERMVRQLANQLSNYTIVE